MMILRMISASLSGCSKQTICESAFSHKFKSEIFGGAGRPPRRMPGEYFSRGCSVFALRWFRFGRRMFASVGATAFLPSAGCCGGSEGKVRSARMRSGLFSWRGAKRGLVGCGLAGLLTSMASGETMLQYFNASWNEIAEKVPELAEAGYSSLWLPPPAKANGGYSVGYDLFDPFDLGSKDQRGTIATRYGTKADLHNLIELCHRFGIRVYFDNIMNHRAYDVPGYNETTPTDVFPGMVAEDFHLRTTSDGFYRKWDNTRDWQDAWQVMHLGLSDLLDIAHETPNQNFGPTEGSWHDKPSIVRHPQNPEYYDWHPTQGHVGFNSTSITAGVIAANPEFYKEDVGAYLCRNARWMMDTTKADGFRLDAVKHVPDYFFGKMWGDDKDSSNDGYLGQIQWQFNKTHGYSDPNHRDSNFNTERPRDDALLFGEHLGQPPGYDGYVAAGMRLVDNDLRNQLNWRFSAGDLAGYDNAGAGGFAPDVGVMHAQSHDNDYVDRKELQHAYYFLRGGLGLLYTDGNRHAETLSGSGGAFPRWASTAFLGQWSQPHIPELLKIHENGARYTHHGMGTYWDGAVIAWERGGNFPWNTFLTVFNSSWDQWRTIPTKGTFPEGAYLYNYARTYRPHWKYEPGWPEVDYAYAGSFDGVEMPPNSYSVWGYKNPDPSSLWPGDVISITDDGQLAETISVDRRDGPDGDAEFNPNNYGNRGYPVGATPAAYTYRQEIPRITKGTNVVFTARVDGSADNVLMRLNGGMDLNGDSHSGGDSRDNPPALSDDMVLGFEGVNFVQRIWPEKFASVNSVSNKIGSEGSTSYEFTSGSSGINAYEAQGVSNDYSTAHGELSWVYHDPTAMRDGAGFEGDQQFWPYPQDYALSGTTYISFKSDKQTGVRPYLYYTTNGLAWPEGAGGKPANNATKVLEAVWIHDGVGTSDWWQFQLPTAAAGTKVRFKIGAARQQGYDETGWQVVWPSNSAAIYMKSIMLGEWETDAQNLKTKSYHAHNNYNSWTTNGLADGFHLLTARAFLGRDDGAPVFNTFRQTFYLDTETPQGYVQYPAADGETYYGSEYGFIVRSDPSVREVWYHITDDNPQNDGPGNGFHTNGAVVWAKASTVGAWTEDMAEDTAHPQIWRFNYARIPATGTATVRVRLREWSSSATNAWSASHPTNDNAAAGHYTELERTLITRGPAEEFYFDWPAADGAMVEAGWRLRVNYSASMAESLSAEQIYERTRVYVNSTANGSTNRGALISAADLNFSHSWNGAVNTLEFAMPNVYNGQDGWLYGVRVEFANGIYDKAATRLVQHRGPLLPTLIITTPPETDSDGAKTIIRMEDVPASVLATNPALRQTPIVVLTDANATNLAIQFNGPLGYVGNVVLDNVVTNGDSLTWNHVWTVTNAGAYRFTATVGVNTNGTELSSTSNSATRNATVQFRELVSTTNAADADWDDDGILNTNEVSACPLPDSAAEYWTQTEVFNYFARGKSMENSPDTDGDGLPDGLELGYRWPAGGTDVNVDTDGDGFKNFLADLDPPFYNTLDNLGKVKDIDGAGTGASRTKRVQGSTTDPTNPDSDYDGLPDGIEDANRNGWVDGDGASLPTDRDPFLSRNWPDGVINSGETWLETSPSIADSDRDGLSDGYGEDKNFNGYLDVGLANTAGVVTSLLANASVPKLSAGSRIIDRTALFAAYPNAVFLETCPLTVDTDGDGLPDGWEVRYGLDPLDSGILGQRSLRTGLIITNTLNGAAGNPDGDTYLDVELVEQPYVNLLEYQNGTDPTRADSIADPGGEGAIVVGQGAILGTVNGTDYYREFMDWTLDDLLALDNYNQGGNSSDIYRRGDGFDSSRDMVAFYFRDGGAADGKLYFRVDFDDLKANAEQSALNIYVAINFGTYGTGEVNLPDEVNAGSLMKWNACIGVYDGGSGVLYVDGDPNNNTTDIGGDLTAAGVVSVPGVFQGAYFNSELDAVAWSIDRAALVAAGWNGNPDVLKFQVYTTSDFTGDDGGSGDKGGLNDFTDTIGDDWLCSDYYQDYNYIAANGYYASCVGRTAGGAVWNNRGQHAKVALLAHGNQAVEPGITIQNIVDNGSGAGYQRPVKIHNIYSNAALNLHITPTLAMALEWAKVGTANTWYSGPGLNEQIRAGVAAGTFRLLGSTFSDHILKYFDAAYNRANVQLATDILNEIYGGSPTSGVVSTNVFWIPERVADVGTLKQVKTNLGFRATILDQTPHLLEWYGREESLADNAYKINRIYLENPGGDWPTLDAFVIATAANNYRYVNTDGGLPTELRQLFNRRARSGADQISTIFYMWEDLSANANADAYDVNLRWMANHPWIKVIALDEALGGETVNRDLTAADGVKSQDWVHHASNEDYDNWYYGSGRHEGLAPKVFEVRIGTNLPSATRYGSMTNGILSNAWKTVQALAHADVKRLAQQTLFASTFETAFHNEDNGNLSRWSFGDYVSPAADWMGLQGFAWKAQGQTRMAALYAAVDDWAGRTLSATEAVAADVDLDGENEYVLRNDSVMALFERSGGRMVGAWLKTGTHVVQMIGNFVSMPDSGTEDEGADNLSGGGVGAYRTSALKDWWDGSANHVNDLYVPSLTANSLTFSNAGIVKTVSLASVSTNVFAVSYAMPGKTLYVRNGLSPDLDALLRTGQRNLAEAAVGAASLAVATYKPSASLASTVKLAVATGSINVAATDMSNTWNTVNMRNQAQTRQVELVGTNALVFTIELASSVAAPNEPPVLEFTPPGPYVMPVGATSSFTVAASDYDSPSTTLTASNLPVGGTKLAAFDANTGIFAWHVTALSQGGRTNDVVYTNTTFAADDGTDATQAAVVITVPWDADADGMPDDWELLKMGTTTNGPDGDWDGDGFPNFNEWWASTDPQSSGSYIGWENQVTLSSNQVRLTFQSVAGRSYQIQGRDGDMISPAPWVLLDTVVSDSNATIWTDTNAVPDMRNYRIKIPAVP
ncbi:MAG: hypothetical protein EOM72_04410 [Opitutae bacterium]|nr:hypothetical protein [Opitutae bacterium]